jgi:hypothetical protein
MYLTIRSLRGGLHGHLFVAEPLYRGYLPGQHPISWKVTLGHHEFHSDTLWGTLRLAAQYARDLIALKKRTKFSDFAEEPVEDDEDYD